MIRTLKTVIAVASLLSLLHAPARSQDVEAFYKGKQIKLIIGAEPGSDYDLWGRLLARYMGSHIPGKPVIVAQNMPGAGQIIATNHLFNIAEKDGTVIGSIGRNLPYMALTQNPQVRFDPRQFNWIGSPEVRAPRLRGPPGRAGPVAGGPADQGAAGRRRRRRHRHYPDPDAAVAPARPEDQGRRGLPQRPRRHACHGARRGRRHLHFLRGVLCRPRLRLLPAARSRSSSASSPSRSRAPMRRASTRSSRPRSRRRSCPCSTPASTSAVPS